LFALPKPIGEILPAAEESGIFLQHFLHPFDGVDQIAGAALTAPAQTRIGIRAHLQGCAANFLSVTILQQCAEQPARL
jgi:hypothetical protein